jgi:hypothetical protein
MVQIKPIDEYGLKLREELDDLWLGEVEPPSGVNAVAYASVFTAPDGSPKLLFNAGDLYDVYVADVDESLEVENPLKLPVRGMSPSIAYDEVAGRWYLLVQSAVKSRRFGFYILSGDFKSVVASQDPLLVGGVEWNTGGHGFLHYFRNLYAFVDGGRGTELLKFLLSDLRSSPPKISPAQRPYPITVEANTYATYAGEYGHGWAHDGVSGSVCVGDEIVFLLSVHNGFGDRGLTLCHTNFDAAKDTWATGVEYDMFFGPRTYGNGWYVGAFDYGCITDVLKRRYILLVNEWIAGRTPLCKTYALRLPWWFLSPRGKRLIYSLWLNNSIAAGETSPAMPGWGRKTIHFTSNTAGDLTTYLDAVGQNDWKTVGTHTGVTSVLAQTEWSGLRMRFGFSAAATVTLHVLVEG